jgi:HSP20 family protein
MARDRDLLVNFERMRREMDELFGDLWGGGRRGRAQMGFSPRVDVYFCGDPPKAIVKAELAGVRLETINLEVVGRELVITGVRAIREIEGRTYQQVEIEAGPFRRVIELNADVEAERAKATYVDGILRVELPLRTGVSASRRVPVDTQE